MVCRTDSGLIKVEYHNKSDGPCGEHQNQELRFILDLQSRMNDTCRRKDLSLIVSEGAKSSG